MLVFRDILITKFSKETQMKLNFLTAQIFVNDSMCILSCYDGLFPNQLSFVLKL